MKTRKIHRFLAGLTGVQVFLLIVFFSCSASLALLKIGATLTNRFVLANPDIEIDEPGVEDPGAVEWGPEAKQVQIVAGPEQGDVYIRVALVLSARDTKGQLLPFDFGLGGAPDANGRLVAGDFTLHFAADWQHQWFYKEGYFYFRGIVAPGQGTSVLLTGLTYTGSTAAKEKYRNLQVDVDVLADSIQARGGAVTVWGVALTGDGRLEP